MATVVIIGGGAGGAAAARRLRGRLHSKHRVFLVEKEPVLFNPAALPLLAAGVRRRDELSRGITRLHRHGIQVVVEQALKIDHPARRVFTENHEITYDLLIIAAGAGFDAVKPAGMAEAGYNMHTLEGAAGIYGRIQNFEGEEIALLAPSTRARYPFSLYEYAFRLENWFKRQERGKDIRVTVYTAEPAPLHVFGKKVSEAAGDLLLQRNISVHPNSRVLHVDPAEKTIRMERGTFPFDLLLYCPEAAPHPLIRESGLADGEGWLPVNRGTHAPSHDGVLGIGDATSMTTPAGEVLPKMGSIARGQSLVAAANAARLIRGKQMMRSYNGRALAFLDTGRGALLFSGNFFENGLELRSFPFSRLWSPLRALLYERRWLKDHT